MEFIFVILGIVVVLGVGLGLMSVRAESKAQSDNRQLAASTTNFTPAVSHAGTGQSSGVAIDAQRQKFAIINARQGGTTVFDFRDLVAVEVFRNETSITKTNRGSQAAGAAIGGVLLGPVGLLVGGLSGSKRNESFIKRLTLKVFTNDLVKPVHEICFYDSMGGKGFAPDSFVLQAPMRELDEWHGRFQTILAMQTNLGPRVEQASTQQFQWKAID